MSFIKVWNLQRSSKVYIKILNDEDSLLKKLITEASRKLNIIGEKLVLESDGTVVDEDEILLSCSREVLLLLKKDESWVSAEQQNTDNLTNFSNSTIDNELELLAEYESLPSISSQNSLASSRTTNSEYAWIQFDVPWKILTSYMLSECEAGTRSKLTITTIVHAVVNKMREIKTNIPSKAFKFVAKKMIDKYPQMFIDMDDDNVILGDGSASLLAKLQDRNNYLNRPHKTKLIMENPVTNKRQKMNARAGCSNWQPEFESSEENEENIPVNATTDDPDFYKSLEKSYPNQRKLINSNPPISELKLKLPVLFIKEGIFWHFKKLTEIDIQQLPIIFESKEDLIIQFLLTKKTTSDSERENFCSSVDKKYIYLFSSISKYFKEKFEEFCPKIQNNLSNFKPENMSPVLAEYQDKFYIYIDRCLLFNEGTTFMNALQIVFAMYFNLNMEYPAEFTTTLEFIQRYFLKIHPDSGSKTKIKASSTKKKCILLMSQLNNFNKKKSSK